MRRWAKIALLAVTVAVGYACTHDFDQFHVGGDAGPAGGMGVGGNLMFFGGNSNGGTSAGGTPATGGTGAVTGGMGGALTGGAGFGGADGGPMGGAGSGGLGGGGAGSGGLGGGCSATQKLCGTSCVSTSDPLTGCAAVSCTACILPQTTTAKCTSGACDVQACANGWGNCNAQAADGCEYPVSQDPEHCGSCSRVCNGTNVAALECSGSLCTSSCTLGSGNCVRPSGGTDDGCETNTSSTATQCGSCSNVCPAGFRCTSSLCECTPGGASNGGCKTGTGSPNCNAGLCVCGGTTCAHGEFCSSGACSCNSGAACSGGQTCCQTPAGCKDLNTDAASCGACGRACTTGFICAAGLCECDSDADCNVDTGAGAGGAPSIGTCMSGKCVCNTTTCAEGQRCLPSGGCG
ncbi:MAG TPA: hypothetical protein VGJ84_04415 [Polyangiaceae bacterium]|jgi:hypothetical protein